MPITSLRSLFFISLFVSTYAFACPEITESLEPSLSIKIKKLCRPEYEMAYSLQRKSPVWVGENLTREELSDSEPRLNLFRDDPDLPEGSKAELRDYVGSGYDRGHLAPAGDASTIDGMIQSFYLSNMVPQMPANNRGIWKSVEMHVRSWAKARGQLVVFTGPIFGKEPLTIGPDKIPVPRALFKIMYDAKTRESLTLIVPNEKIPSSLLPKYVSTLAQVKKEAGIEFLSGLKPLEGKQLWNISE